MTEPGLIATSAINPRSNTTQVMPAYVTNCFSFSAASGLKPSGYLAVFDFEDFPRRPGQGNFVCAAMADEGRRHVVPADPDFRRHHEFPWCHK